MFANIIIILFYYYYCCIMYLLPCHGEIKLINTVTLAEKRELLKLLRETKQ